LKFEEAVLPHLEFARDLAVRLTGSEEDGDDVSQEAILRAYRYFAGFRGHDGLAWLTAIVRNTFRTWRRQRPEWAPDPARVRLAFWAEPQLLLRADVQRAVAALPDPLRRVFDLREREGLTYLEIGRYLGITVAAAAGRAARARQRLQRKLRQGEGEDPN
jgi:RNA polymerase sigma-70 factor (ECF subfamily)